MRLHILLPILLAFSAAAELPPAPSGMIDWPIPWNDDVPGLVSADALIAKPAGKEGFVVSRDGHFYTGQTRIRFWGVNTCFAADFPTHDQADATARRLARFGFNCVRLHHMDNQTFPNGIFADKSLEKLSPEALDRLDYFISALKQQGIYVNLNLHVSRWYSKSHNWPGADKTESYDKVVDQFYPELIAAQKTYARDLLHHVNAYTKLRYADDPAIAIVEINNENSIFMWNGDGILANLAEPFAGELRKQWNAFLVGRYGTREKLAAAWQAGLEPDGPNLIPDPNCETLGKPNSPWATEMHEGAKMTLSRDDGGVKLTVPTAVEPGWHLQFNCIPVSLKKNQMYAVRFMARTDKPGARLTAGTQQAHEPWESMGLSASLNLSADWQEYQLGFKAAKDDDRVKLNFCSAYQAASVWIKNVQLFSGGQIGLRADEDPASGSVALCRKGAPFAAARLRDWHGFLQQTDEKYYVGMYDFLKKDLGVKCSVTGTIAYGPLGTIAQSRLDFVDQHAYWEHPHFPRRPWDPNDWTINNKPMSDSPSGSTFPTLAMTRVAGKPYTVTEYQHSAPNEWQAECMPMIAAFAAAQDWDGIFIFAYSHTTDLKRPRTTGFFDIEGNTSKMAPAPLAARMFLGGAIEPLRRKILIPIDYTQSLDNVANHWFNMPTYISAFHGVSAKDLLGSRFEVSYRNEAFVPRAKPIDPDTRMTWTANGPGTGKFTFIDDHAAVFTGFPAGQSIKLGPITLDKIESPFAVVMVVPANPAQTLEKADRLLVCALGRTDNAGMQWDAKRQSVGNHWGNGPARLETVRCEIKSSAGRTLKIQPLTNEGKPATSSDTVLFTIDQSK